MTAQEFEIVVQGTLGPTVLGALEGFRVSRVEGGTTHLVGWVPDQSRLHGVLTVLQDLHVELTSVNPIRA
jgi:hypothetical protein